MPRSKKSKKPPKIIATLDCETDPFAHGSTIDPFIWGLYWKEDNGLRAFKTFQHIDEVLAFCDNGREWLIYAHNGGRFDFYWLMNYLKPESNLLYIHNRLAKFTIDSIEFRDSFCILQCKLADYQKDDIDYNKFTKSERHKHMPEIKKYLMGDCAYLYDLVMAFRDQYGTSLTLAGAAFKYWQTMYDCKPPTSNLGYYQRMSAFYYGGRVQAFKKGINHSPVSMVDICSAYPYAMMQRHPLGTEFIASCPGDDEPIEGQGMYSVSCEGKGLLPARDANGGIAFPECRGVFHCTGWEVLAYIDITGKRPHIVKALIPTDCRDFSRYVTHFYELKKRSEKGSADYIMAKLLMNSLYGKFAANPEEYQEYQLIPINMVPAFLAECRAMDMDAECVGTHNGLGIIASPLNDEDKHFYNVATGASVTGFVRAYLARAMHAIRTAGGEVLYCDTDSIAFIGGEGHGLPIGKELGQWEYEGGKPLAFDCAAIAGRKMYAMHKAGKSQAEENWKTACKGVQLKASEILKVAGGAEVEYRREAPSFDMRTGACRYITRRVKIT